MPFSRLVTGVRCEAHQAAQDISGCGWSSGPWKHLLKLLYSFPHVSKYSFKTSISRTGNTILSIMSKWFFLGAEGVSSPRPDHKDLSQVRAASAHAHGVPAQHTAGVEWPCCCGRTTVFPGPDTPVLRVYRAACWAARPWEAGLWTHLFHPRPRGGGGGRPGAEVECSQCCLKSLHKRPGVLLL